MTNEAKKSLRVAALMSTALAVGAIAGSAVTYGCVARRYRTQYEELYLAEIQGSILLVEKLRAGDVEPLIKRYDVFLGQSAKALRAEFRSNPSVAYTLWQIETHYRTYNLPTDSALEAIFREIPDDEPPL